MNCQGSVGGNYMACECETCAKPGSHQFAAKAGEGRIIPLPAVASHFWQGPDGGFRQSMIFEHPDGRHEVIQVPVTADEMRWALGK